MSSPCIHGFDPATCLICRTLATDAQPSAAPAASSGRRARHAGPSTPVSVPARPDRVYAASPPEPPGPARSWSRSALLVLAALLAIGAAVWILAGVVFTVLRLFELIVVAAGAGWVGYKVGHFRGSRHPRR